MNEMKSFKSPRCRVVHSLWGIMIASVESKTIGLRLGAMLTWEDPLLMSSVEAIRLYRLAPIDLSGVRGHKVFAVRLIDTSTNSGATNEEEKRILLGDLTWEIERYQGIERFVMIEQEKGRLREFAIELARKAKEHHKEAVQANSTRRPSGRVADPRK